MSVLAEATPGADKGADKVEFSVTNHHLIANQQKFQPTISCKRENFPFQSHEFHSNTAG